MLNQKQTELRRAMEGSQHEHAIALFLAQHARLHAAEMAGAAWSYQDKVLADLDEMQIRRIPRTEEHSVLWCLWHITRIEDVTMGLLVAKGNEVREEGQWDAKLCAPIIHTANALSATEVAELSQAVDINALLAYRNAVGKRTQKIVTRLEPGTLQKKVGPAQIERVSAKGLVHPDAQGVIDYWRKRTVAGLLLMPASRHILVHLNEAARIKGRRK